jgi:uncharacterized surface protein with fasciclin (FAS1) repeats
MKNYLKLPCYLVIGTFAVATSLVKAADKDIVDTAVAAGDFKILAKALQVTGLDKALKEEGSFTVFAPTDEAFMRLPKGTLDTLLQPENKDQLVSILTYHVVAGNVDGATAVTLKEATTLNGEKLEVAFKNAALYLDKSRVTATDIKATNGVIHVIDSVLIPKNIKQAQSLVKGKGPVSKKILSDAIDVGVDLFNADNEAACAAIYKIAVIAVFEIAPEALDQTDLNNLEKALVKVNASDDQRANAWTLRRAMDAIFVKLSK